MTFPALSGLAHGFTLRHPTIDVDGERIEVLQRLEAWHSEFVQDLGFAPTALRTASQVHGRKVTIVGADSPTVTADADGLITNEPGILLGIYVADCGVVFLADHKNGALGLVHSGKKGTELGIVPHAIELMGEAFGSKPEDIIVQLGPCIRPPAYEVDFAADLRTQCLAAGVLPSHLNDCGICTSSDPQRYYSYRLEKGRTGRMLGLLGKRPA
ncbi:MAG: hypothetical protein JWO08_1340 [Verrucomicrobiaceae bacterium]|nr:hypothetical protein [Verrucomicrobiaceae bacterium]